MRLPAVDAVAVDVEASGLHPDDGARLSCVGLAWAGGSVALPFDQGERDKIAQLALQTEADPNMSEDEWRQLLGWLGDGKSLVMHNAKYDLAILQTGTRQWPGRDFSAQPLWDTMIAGAVLEPLQPQALDAVAARLRSGSGAGVADGAENGNGDGAGKLRLDVPGGRYDLLPWPAIRDYVRRDAELAWEVYERQRQQLLHADADALRFDREMKLLTTLYRMENRGVMFDVEASLAAARRLQRRADELQAQLPFAATPAGAKAYFFLEQGLTPERLTERGAPSLDAEQLQQWVADGVRYAAEYAEMTKCQRAVAMWYEGYPAKVGLDGRLRTRYKQTRVKSGRMSVERVQLQAMPRGAGPLGVPGVRSLLRAPAGKQLWSLDLSQAELRVAAQYAGCDKMLAMLRAGEDLHGRTAERVIGARPGEPDWKAKRDVAKRLNFASVFQVGAGTFQATISKETGRRIAIAEAETLIANWRREYPEFGRAHRRSEVRAAQAGNVWLLPDTPYAMRSWFGPRDDHSTAWSRRVQGSLAEFFKLWMLQTDEQLPGTMLLVVHDSILLELDAETAPEQAEAVATAGATLATGLFGTEMKVDAERWA